MSALSAAEIIVRPGRQREVDRRVRSRQVHVRGPREGQQDPDQGCRGGALQEGGRDRRVGQRPHHEGQGEATRDAARPDRRPYHALEEGHRHAGPGPEDRILRGGLTMPLRSYKPTSPGLRQMTRSTFEEITTKEPYKPLLEAAEAWLRAEQPGPHDGPAPRWRREAALPQDRFQAGQDRRSGSRRDDRVRPEPLGADRPAPLPRRREALHAAAARPQGRRRRRVRARGRGTRRQRAAAREHPARHHDPQHRADTRQGWPDRPVRRHVCPAAGEGRWLRHGPDAVGRDAPHPDGLHGDRRPGQQPRSREPEPRQGRVALATWASGPRCAAS